MNKICKNSSNEKSRKGAFTLAEVLITLGIIGVVAALTVPTLLQNYEKKYTATSLKRFTSIIRNVTQMRQKDITWGSFSDLNSADIRAYNGADELVFFNRYWAPYIKTTSVEALNKGVLAKLPDGTAIYLFRDCNYDSDVYTCQMLTFCTKAKYCEGIDPVANSKASFLNDTRHRFLFFTTGPINWYSSNRSGALNGCTRGQNYKGCGELIQYDGWQIKDDYPW